MRLITEKTMQPAQAGADPVMPLGILSAGERAEVTELRAMPPIPLGNGTCITHACRMEEMGLRAGKSVEMLNNNGQGALLVKIDETRIAISRGMAMKVMVRRMNG